MRPGWLSINTCQKSVKIQSLMQKRLKFKISISWTEINPKESDLPVNQANSDNIVWHFNELFKQPKYLDEMPKKWIKKMSFVLVKPFYWFFLVWEVSWLNWNHLMIWWKSMFSLISACMFITWKRWLKCLTVLLELDWLKLANEIRLNKFQLGIYNIWF